MVFRDGGTPIGRQSNAEGAGAHMLEYVAEPDLQAGIAALIAFTGAGPMTQTVADLEHAVAGLPPNEIESAVARAGLSAELLRAGLLVRESFGRVDDIIHASAISVVLPKVLEEGEALKRPSLAAGNDPSRQFDVETDRRIAEFKLARWRGADAMRKRQVFKDLVNLTLDETERRAELYVLGERPIRFLRSTKSSASWGLDRAPGPRVAFEARYGGLDMPIGDFVAGPGSRVELIDLEERWPDLFAPWANRG
jgi:hypothetical protein